MSFFLLNQGCWWCFECAILCHFHRQQCPRDTAGCASWRRGEAPVCHACENRSAEWHKQIRANESEILEGPSYAAIMGGVRHRGPISGELGVSIHRGAAWLVVTHTSTVQNIQHILSLWEKQTVIGTLNIDTQKMMKRPHVCHRQFPAKSWNNVPEKTCRWGRKNNVINI